MKEKIKDILVGVILAIVGGSVAGQWESSPLLLGAIIGLFCFVTFILGAVVGNTWSFPMVIDLLKVIKQMEDSQEVKK